MPLKVDNVNNFFYSPISTCVHIAFFSGRAVQGMVG